ncbi:MAG TPA: hypothetical protein PL151_11195 [Phycisphaerae bacterium]|nr:hypothetical protein [Phycisphaerae bacterium]HOJ74927.1 hypothetical protein [Phycisphaerae bacterium]HOM51488.1 hypothetical protein [Phycisphaerae bacterium]HPP27016.1 hypothetical protein [Phycisphaerae bacterium]HPU27353.1 hypothetical protein [Phycisphaerae bacterium]
MVALANVPAGTKPRRRGITLSETLVTAAALAVVLAALGLGTEGIRNDLKRQQAVAMMEILDQALVAYHAQTGAWPVDADSGARPAAAADEDADSPSPERYEADPAAVDRMLALMAGVPAARARLETLPAVLRVAPAESARSAGAWGSIRDPWGRPLHCLTASSPLAVHRKAVAANQGRPIFISAGPDGRFGFQDVSAASDNIRSDEIGQ